MDDIAQDPTSSTPAERVARGRAIWDWYCTQYGGSTAVQDVIADLLHFADADVTGGAGTVVRSARSHYYAERTDTAPEAPLFDENGNYSPPRPALSTRSASLTSRVPRPSSSAGAGPPSPGAGASPAPSLAPTPPSSSSSSTTRAT